MGKILLDYAFPISTTEPTPDVNLGYLKKCAAMVKPNGDFTSAYAIEVYNADDCKKYTENVSILKLFTGGLSAITLIVTDTLANADSLCDDSKFFTIGISGDFEESEAKAFAPTEYKGVMFSTITDASNVTQPKNTTYFLDKGYNTEGSFFAFGSFLSGTYWRDMQYLEAAKGSDDWTAAETLGEANTLFDDGVSFWIKDDEYGTRLGFFGCGSNAIAYPYIKEEINREIQSGGLKYLTVNQALKTSTERVRLEDYLNSIIKPYELAPYSYLDPDKDNEIKLFDSNERYVMNGQMFTNVAEPLWRVKIEAIEGAI